MEDDGEAASANGVGEPAGGLDRLAGLMRVISADVVREALRDTDRANERCCVLSHEVTTWVLLAMGVLTDLPIRRVYQHARRLRPGDVIPTRSALCQARRRLGVAPLRAVFERVVRPLVDDRSAGCHLRRPAVGRHRRHQARRAGHAGRTWRRSGEPAGGRGDGRVPAGAQGQPGRTRQPTRRELAFVVKPCRRNEAVIAWGPPPPREARHAGVLAVTASSTVSPCGKPFRAAAPTCSGGSAATSR